MKKIIISLTFLLLCFLVFSDNAFASTTTTVSSLMQALREEKQESVYNLKLNAPFSKETSNIKERVNIETGEVTVENEIVTIPGRNNQDLTLKLVYRSRDAKLYDEGTKAANTTNNYGATITAYYDVYDSNGYWLRTGGLSYTTSETTILGETTINNEKWVFTGYLQTTSGTSLLTASSIANFAKDRISKYIFGTGWDLDIPSLDIDGADVYVSLSNGQVYKADFTSGNGLKDYPIGDAVLTKDTSYTNGIETSAYKLQYINGSEYYFLTTGELIAEKNKFGDTITYQWETINGRRMLTKVFDNTGRTVNIQDNDTAITFIWGNNKAQIIKQLIPGKTNRYYLDSFIDPEGRITKYIYNFDNAEFDLLGKTPAINTYSNLTQIIYPTGLKVNYTYEKSKKNLGSTGSMEYFKIKKRWDSEDKEVVNLQRYNYYNEPDGYPIYKVNAIDELYKYCTEVIDSNNIKTKYYYNSKHQIYMEQIFSDKLISETRTEYHVNYNMPTRNVIKTYNEKGNVIEKQEKYEYDYRGNLLSENKPKEVEDINTEEYKIKYTYDYRYNMLIKKVYKQDKDTTIEEIYTLTSDNKNIEFQKVYSNGKILINKKFTYDDFGNLISVSTEKEPNKWVTVKYEYFSEYKYLYPTAEIYEDVEDADGNKRNIKVTYTYDYITGQKLSQKDGNGNITEYEYDKIGRTKLEKLPDGNERTYIYDDQNNILETANANGNKLIYYYDKSGNLEKVTESVNKATLAEFTYDDNNNLISRTDGNGNVRRYVYDNQNRLIKVSNKDKSGTLLSESKIAYDEANSEEGDLFNKIIVTEKGDGIDKITSYYFDTFERLIKLKEGKSGNERTASYNYDYLGNKTEETSFDGQKTKYINNALGQNTKIINQAGYTKEYKYDQLGNLAVETNEIGEKVYTEYDLLGRKILQKTPFETGKYSITKMYYDANSNLIKITDPEGFETKYYYTNRNFLDTVEQKVSESKSNIVKIGYDKEGNMTEVLTGLNSFSDNDYVKTAYKYDELGRRIQTISPDGSKAQYEYDNNGNITKVTDKNGIVTENIYDGLNRLIEKNNNKEGSKNVITYEYNLLGNLIKAEDSQEITTLKYDKSGRIKQIAYDSGIKKKYSYDILDRVTNFNVTQGSIDVIDTAYTYDDLGRMTSIKDGEKQYTYEYDPVGKVLEKENLITGIKAVYKYYPSGQVKSLRYLNQEEIIENIEYKYDQRGNQTEKEEKQEKTKYTYDALGRIKTVEMPNSVLQNYEYDDYSNISEFTEINGVINKTTYLYDKNNRLLQSASSDGEVVNFEYDFEGNQVLKEEILKGIGSKKHQYNYNGYNQLERVITPEGKIVEYIYNTEGLRNKKVSGEDIINYYYDNQEIVVETNKDNKVTAKNIHGGNILFRETEDKLISYLDNAHGDIIKTLEGKNTQGYTYDPFGREAEGEVIGFGRQGTRGLWEEEIDAEDNPYKYCGEYFDEETGFYYLRARYYDSKAGRFISEDSFEGTVNNPLSFNLYTYCGNDPVNYIDPSGHIAMAAVQGLVQTPIGQQVMMKLVEYDTVISQYVAAGGQQVVNWGATYGPAVVDAIKQTPDQIKQGTNKIIKGVKNKLNGSFSPNSPNDPKNKQKILEKMKEIINKSKVVTKGTTGESAKAVDALIKNADKLQGTATVMKNVSTRPYINSTLTMRQIMGAANPIKDSGTANGLKWVVQGTFNNAKGIYEFVIDTNTQRILHFLFKSKE